MSYYLKTGSITFKIELKVFKSKVEKQKIWYAAIL